MKKSMNICTFFGITKHLEYKHMEPMYLTEFSLSGLDKTIQTTHDLATGIKKNPVYSTQKVAMSKMLLANGKKESRFSQCLPFFTNFFNFCTTSIIVYSKYHDFSRL